MKIDNKYMKMLVIGTTISFSSLLAQELTLDSIVSSYNNKDYKVVYNSLSEY